MKLHKNLVAALLAGMLVLGGAACAGDDTADPGTDTEVDGGATGGAGGATGLPTAPAATSS